MQIATQYHKVLERQIRKIFGKDMDISEELLPLLDLVSRTYEQYDDEKELLNNTMDVGMRELAETNQVLAEQKQALEVAYHQLTETQNKLSEAEQIVALTKEIAQKNEALIASEEELKQNLEELQAAQEHLYEKQNALTAALTQNKAVMNALDKSAIVSITDLKGIIIKANQAFCQVSGYTEEELLGKSYRIVSSDYHSQQFWADMWTTISKGETWRAEICNRAKDGSLYWVDAVINPIYDENGKIYQYLAIRHLITARKQAEQTIQEQNQALQESLEKVILLQQNSEKAKEEAERLFQNVTDSINYAKRIQDAIIPKPSELRKYFDSFVFFRPRDIVSGDFYWLADKDVKKIIAVADCTGHGVSGAFMTMIGNNILNQIVHNHEIHEPDEILNLIPILLEKTFKHSEGKVKDGMDISIITLYQNEEEKVNRIEYAGAKTSLCYVYNQTFHEIKGDRVAIWGNFKEDFFYQKHTIWLSDPESTLPRNDEPCMLYMFSDGYQDQFGGENGRKYMSNNFKNLLFQSAYLPMYDQKTLLKQHFEDWKGTHKQTDDVLVLGLRV